MMTTKQTKNEDKGNLRCPYCGETFDFESLSKNDWGVESEYLLIQCQMCGKVFKILIESQRETER